MPGALGFAAEAMGVTRAELVKLIEQGKVAADEFLPNFIDVLHGKAKGGLPDALKKTFTAVGRLKNAFQTFVDVLFRSGVDDFFATVLNIVSDLFKIAEPFVALFGTTFFTILKNLLLPIRLIFALVSDLIRLLDRGMNEAIGVGLTDSLIFIGKVLGNILSFFSSAIIGIAKGIGWVISKIGILGNVLKPIWNILKNVIDTVATFMGKGGTASNMVRKAGNVSSSIARVGQKVKPEMLAHAAKFGPVSEAARQGVDVSVKLRGDADSMFKASVENNTSGRLDSDTRE